MKILKITKNNNVEVIVLCSVECKFRLSNMTEIRMASLRTKICSKAIGIWSPLAH